jgi:hypothetical protein
MAARMSAWRKPFRLSQKGFVADDGERVTIIEFESEEALREWRIHPEHAKAKRCGIESFFSDYRFQIWAVVRGQPEIGGKGHNDRVPGFVGGRLRRAAVAVRFERCHEMSGAVDQAGRVRGVLMQHGYACIVEALWSNGALR